MLSYQTVLVNTVFIAIPKNILNFISRPSDPKTFTMWSLARWSLRLLTALVLPHGCKGGQGRGRKFLDPPLPPCRLPQGHGGHPQGHRAGLQPCEGEDPLLLLTSDICPSTLVWPSTASIWAPGTSLAWPVQLSCVPHHFLAHCIQPVPDPLQGRGESQ